MPSLDETRSLIINSDRERDWHDLAAGPFFTDAPDVDEDTFHQHDNLLVYRDDVALTIQWGMRPNYQHLQLKRVSELWQEASFLDESIHIYRADVFWNGTLIDRENVVSVDGGRALLPLGTRTVPPGYEPRISGPVAWVYSCTSWQAALAFLLDSGGEHRRYFEETGMTVRG
jgi:hypothetical protein